MIEKNLHLTTSLYKITYGFYIFILRADMITEITCEDTDNMLCRSKKLYKYDQRLILV